MKIDTTLLAPQIGSVGDYSSAAEQIGFDGLWISETNSEPFLNLTLAAAGSSRLDLGSGIAVAFARSPFILALIAWDLQRLSHGRFVLGLGTQVRAHNERRLGVRWEKPVRKMRETIEAIQALWNHWQDGAPLRYEGEFFKLNLSTPFFRPPPLSVARPPIYIAAVNENMLRLVGKRCDGVFLHALHTRRYLTEFAIPQIAAGAEQAGRDVDRITLSTAVFAIPTDDVKAAAAHEQYARQQISFYMSTPAYRVVAELHGWEATAQRLSGLARTGEWQQMARLVTDEMLSEMAVSGTWAEIGRLTRQKYAGLIDRIGYYLPYEPGSNDAGWQATLAAFRE